MKTQPDHVREKLLQETWVRPSPSLMGRQEPGILVCFANTYEVGMSNLGFQYIWSTCLDSMSIAVDRLFLEPENPGSPCGFTSRRPLAEHRLSLWSISFEEDYFHLAKMLHAAGIPLRAKSRGEQDCFILAGGPGVSANPETPAPLCDAILLGDGEPFMEAAGEVLEEFARGDLSRDELKEALGAIPGVYLPSRNERPILHEYSPSLQMKGDFKVTRAVSTQVKDDVITSRVITPHSVFSNVLMAEMTRGCGWGCRFCLAGYWYRPVRFADPGSLLKRVRELDPSTEMSVGLVGACLVDHPQLDSVTSTLARDGVAYTTSSLRLEKLDAPRIERIVRGGMRTITVAPEAGTQRLRNVIRKTMTNEEILDSGRQLARRGVKKIKLYFMLGLPTETDEDIDGIVSIVDELKAVFSAEGHHPRISLSVSPLVPKPWTAFQWKAMIDTRTHRRRAKLLYRALDRRSGVHLEVGAPRANLRQSVLSLGDRRVGEALILWADGSAPTWNRALKDAGVDSDWILFAEKPDEYLFPWDFVKTGVGRGYLLKEFHRSFQDGGRVGEAAWRQRERDLDRQACR